jgi:hypothetical protein
LFVWNVLLREILEVCCKVPSFWCLRQQRDWETGGFCGFALILRGFPAFDNQRIKASNNLNLTKCLVLG